jgi:glutamate/aspartate transport system substrate-binding protein
MHIKKLLILLLATHLCAGAAVAQERDTLKKIKASNSITLGMRDASIPFSYLDSKQQYQGYTLDLCLKVVAAIEKKLGVAKLTVVLNPVTAATRVPLMVNGTIDLECGSTTNNPERQKQVSFAPTSFLTATRVVAKKSAHINGLADLRGKTLVSTSGTSNLKALMEVNAAKNLGINIVTAKDHAEAFLMVETGRAVAFGMDDVLLAALVANAKAPADYAITDEAMTAEPYGIMLRRDDPAFKQVVDAALNEVYTSGDITRIYAKWFLAPVPPKGINLNWPMSAQLQRNFAKPSDSGDPAVYK